MSPISRKLFLTVALLSGAGMAVSSISLVHHFSRSKTEFCDFSQTFNCDIVNRSQYSSILGIPVALIGIAGYGGLLVLATLYRSQEETPVILLGAASAGLVFALRMTYIEAYVLDAWCVLCLSSLALIFAITALSLALLLRRGRQL